MHLPYNGGYTRGLMAHPTPRSDGPRPQELEEAFALGQELGWKASVFEGKGWLAIEFRKQERTIFASWQLDGDKATFNSSTEIDGFKLGGNRTKSTAVLKKWLQFRE